VTVVTFAVRVLATLAVAAFLAAAVASSTAQSAGLRDVVFVAVSGHGTVTSSPAGIHCPWACRAIFIRGQHVKIVAKPAAGWMVRRITGSCETKSRACAFDLVSAHDCIGGACPTGAFGVTVEFVWRHGAL
jgi:trimeric autotransporter adhesin